MYGVYLESRLKTKDADRPLLEATPEGRKLLQRSDVWGREKRPYVACYRQSAAEQIAFILTEDRSVSIATEARYVVVVDE